MSDDLLNDETLDRLVDGELPADERRRVLAALDAQPDGWRRCALSFLEGQSWRGDMRRLIADATRRDDAQATTTLVAASQQGQSSRDASSKRPRWQAALALAASLLAAFGLGWQVRSPAGGSGAASNAIATASPAEPQDALAPSMDAVTLVLNDLRGAEHRVQVPLVEARRLGEGFADAPQWAASPELQRTLHENGLNMHARRRYAPLYFEQQNRIVPMVVPVDDAVVTPVKRKVL